MRSPRVLLSSDRNTDSEESIRSLNRIRNSKVPSRAEPTENRLEVKMDELILTFQKILERMEEENRNDIKGSREPGSGSVPSKVLAKSEPCSSFKPPVSYFLPLPSLQHPIWIRPPSAVSPVLEKEKSDCDAIPDGKEVRSVLRNDSLPRVSLQVITTSCQYPIVFVLKIKFHRKYASLTTQNFCKERKIVSWLF